LGELSGAELEHECMVRTRDFAPVVHLAY
jgi:hypothetical protein